MSQRDTTDRPADEARPENPPANGTYEPPEVEDLVAPNGPSVTGAGVPTTPAAPREL